MKLSFEIDVNSKEDVDKAMSMLIAFNGDVDTGEEVQTEAPKVEKPKAKKAKAAPVKKQVEETDEENDSEFTIDDVRTKAKELIAGGNRDAVKEILEDLGVDRVTKLTAEQYGQFIGAANDIA